MYNVRWATNARQQNVKILIIPCFAQHLIRLSPPLSIVGSIQDVPPAIFCTISTTLAAALEESQVSTAPAIDTRLANRDLRSGQSGPFAARLSLAVALAFHLWSLHLAQLLLRLQSFHDHWGFHCQTPQRHPFRKPSWAIVASPLELPPSQEKPHVHLKQEYRE